MKIIIAGAGAVGTHLAKLLSREHHDITLIDENTDKLNDMAANFDILTLPLSPSSITALKEAEVGNADLFIGVTPDESHNMTACILASKLGAKKTVARVDNDEYAQPDNRVFFQKIGIDSVIYPEMLAAEEIQNNIKRSWIRQWWDVQNGALILVAVKLRSNAHILNQPLKDICNANSPFHVVAIKRDDETLIPHGEDYLQEFDIVYFMTTPEFLYDLKVIAGKEDYPDVNNVFIMGGSNTSVHLANCLPDYMHAKIIESDLKRSELLNELVTNPHVMILHGDGRDIGLLEEEGIRKAQAFAALTDNSEANILACLTAKRLGVRKTVAIIENTDYISMAESLDIGTIINKKTFAAGHIFRMMLKADVTSVKSLTVANADVAEYQVSETAKVTRKQVKDLKLPCCVTLGGLVRDGKGMLINGNTQILPGDTVMAFCLSGGIKKLEKYFN